MRHIRQLAYSILGGATACLYAVILASGGFDRAGFPLQAALGAMGGIWAMTIVCDVVYHAWKGEGQSCPHCGHLREMASFHLYPVCPKCLK